MPGRLPGIGEGEQGFFHAKDETLPGSENGQLPDRSLPEPQSIVRLVPAPMHRYNTAMRDYGFPGLAINLFDSLFQIIEHIVYFFRESLNFIRILGRHCF